MRPITRRPGADLGKVEAAGATYHASCNRLPGDEQNRNPLPGTILVGQVFSKRSPIQRGESVELASNSYLAAAIRPIGRLVKIGVLYAEKFLIAGAEGQADRVDDGGLAGVVLANQGGQSRLHRKDERLVALTKNAEILYLQLGQKHIALI
ncbi:MAG: hypothetical protein P4L83_13295 [Nevskia sp.]|nr:hypothetical protein [Nevskia sp.]